MPSESAKRTPVVAPLDPKLIKLLDLQSQILDRLVPKLDLDAIPLERLGDENLWQKAEGAIVDLVETMDSSGEVPGYIDQDQLIKESLNEALGLGPLEDLLADDKIDEIIVDRRDRILVGANGNLDGANRAFSSDETFRRVVERLVAPTGHIIDEAHPFVDVRLRDGSRLAAAVPPVAVRGACLTLRKPRHASYNLADLATSNAISPAMADFLMTCVSARRNVLVCGAPGSGKSAVLAALAAAAASGERIVSVEEVSELSLDRDDWIALESRPSDGNGVPAVSLETLLRGALRMRPDRLVVGDIRGGEALELISAMASSNDGTLALIAGDGSQSALARLTLMARLAAPGSSVDAIRELVACAVDVVVHVARYADGIYRIASISEVVGVSDDGFSARELFTFRGGTDGTFGASGVIPSFYGELEARGIPADTSIFRG
jgi:pilus assembly protein CpaF